MNRKQIAGLAACTIAAALLLAGCGNRSAASVPVTRQPIEATGEAEPGDVPAEPPSPPDEGAQDELGFSSGGCRSAFAVGMLSLAMVLTGFSGSTGGKRNRQDTATRNG
jgi:hypothetical protein